VRIIKSTGNVDQSEDAQQDNKLMLTFLLKLRRLFHSAFVIILFTSSFSRPQRRLSSSLLILLYVCSKFVISSSFFWLSDFSKLFFVASCTFRFSRQTLATIHPHEGTTPDAIRPC